MSVCSITVVFDWISHFESCLQRNAKFILLLQPFCFSLPLFQAKKKKKTNLKSFQVESFWSLCEKLKPVVFCLFVSVLIVRSLGNNCPKYVLHVSRVAGLELVFFDRDFLLAIVSFRFVSFFFLFQWSEKLCHLLEKKPLKTRYIITIITSSELQRIQIKLNI